MPSVTPPIPPLVKGVDHVVGPSVVARMIRGNTAQTHATCADPSRETNGTINSHTQWTMETPVSIGHPPSLLILLRPSSQPLAASTGLSVIQSSTVFGRTIAAVQLLGAK
jgi:hypothetical protein